MPEKIRQASFEVIQNAVRVPYRSKDAKLNSIRRRQAEDRRRIERRKELDSGSLTVDELDDTKRLIQERFKIVLEDHWVGFWPMKRRLSRRELLSIASSVIHGESYRDRVVAVRRFHRLGFRVSFAGINPLSNQ